jgi:hypothetical protein
MFLVIVRTGMTPLRVLFTNHFAEPLHCVCAAVGLTARIAITASLRAVVGVTSAVVERRAV